MSVLAERQGIGLSLAWNALDGASPPLRFPYPSAPDPISHTYGANSPPIIPRHSHSHPHPSTSQQHRRASSPPPLKPRPRPPPPPGLSKSPQIFGYQLELPSPQLVPYLIGPRGERSSAIREPAGLVELTLGYLATTLTPVARLQGTYSSIHRGIQGIQDCLRQHPNPNLLGDLESWCDWDPRAMWDMGVPIEMYSCLPPTKKGGVVRPMEGLEEGHPFAEGTVTRLPEKMDIGLEVGIRKGRGKRRYEEIEDQGRERKVSRTTGSGFPSTKNYDHGYYEDPVRHSRRPLPPQRLPSPTSFRHLPSEQVNSHPRRPSSPLPAPSPVFPPSRLPFSSTYISELPSSTSRKTISTEATELLPSSLGDEAQQALRLLRNLPAEQRVQLWGTDPLRSSFNSREPSPAFADSLDRRQDEDEDKSRRSPVFKKEEMSVEGDRRVLAGGEEHGWPIGSAGASEDGEVEEGEIRSSRAGSMMREDRTSEQEPGLVRDRTYEEEEEGDRASPLTEEGDTWEQDVKMADEASLAVLFSRCSRSS
ncbi:hypothetical protein BCR35DRAFT_313345 [Leucosporidium creatinivorum]|uniref:Uncharacterized protein n=1 Tax=Leucosporidium creatinivorum TaxID=106004 RepID=A0A1Y2FTK5_9BASI|nr:hypothetical protein BCR35DRAFT_313345 [Leucosporidium creatinivorum]